MLLPLAPAAAPLGGLAAWPGLEILNRLPPPGGCRPRNARGLPIRFLARPAQGRGGESPYEAAILETGGVPTREANWHDLFNALAWLSFPGAKAALNARHCRARAQREAPARRSPVEDALTGFDESGVVVACGADDLEDLLRGFRWRQLFWERRSEVRSRMKFFLFGHGLCESAMRPFVGLTGKGIVLRVAAGFFGAPLLAQLGALDRALALLIADPLRLRSPRELAPVPLLGVPDWWPGNEAAFYDDTRYFRPGRRRQAA
jgi:hypothetical protein